MDFPAELKRHVARVERGLDQFVPRADTRPARLHTAMRYSLEAGGKRLRPVLLLAAAELFTGDNRTKASSDSVRQSEIVRSSPETTTTSTRLLRRQISPRRSRRTRS